MSRSGDEMMLDLFQLLNKQELVSTAAKEEDKEEDKKEEKEDKLPPFMKKDDKKDKKEEKKDKKKGKKAVVVGVLHELTKLASELDALGADDASAAVDEALRLIVRDLKSADFE